jgi:UDP-N-acetylmuramate dehydrogenase
LNAKIAALRTEIRGQKSEVKIGELLSRYTTSRIGGPAEFLIEATSADELKGIVIATRKLAMPMLMLGGGSNVLVSDAGVRDLTIINKAKHAEFRAGNRVWCESGTVLPTLARECIAHGLGGLEWAVGVPGTIGGAVVGNAGAHGRDIAADLVSATILNANGEVEEWSNADLKFEYRSSWIKSEARNQQSEIVVLAATFELTPTDQ